MGSIHTRSSTRRENGKVDHLSYVVRSADDLLAAEKRLAEFGVKSERIERSPLWRHGSALRFVNPSGQTIELTLGVLVDVPMAALVAEPQSTPARSRSITRSSGQPTLVRLSNLLHA
jgi:hypothetical protein